MQTSQFIQLTALCAVLGASTVAHAGPLAFDQNVTPGVIFGNGNANGGFTVDQSGGIELGLRGKLRHDATGQPANVFNSNGDGTYSFAAGVAPTQAAPTAVWSVEYSINTNVSGTSGKVLSSLTYAFGVDTDASLGTNFLVIDVINGINPGSPGFGTAYWDHALGTNSTVQCNATNSNAGCSGIKNTAASLADYQAKIGQMNVAQNSQKAHWMLGPGFNPNANGTYDFYLAAFDNGVEVGRSSIQIIVGTGGAAVPEPASLALVGLALVGLAATRRRA